MKSGQIVHAVQLWLVELQHIDTNLDQIGDDVSDLAAGVHKDLEVVRVRYVAEPVESGLEHLTPQLGVDHHTILHAPIFREHHPVGARPGVLHDSLGQQIFDPFEQRADLFPLQ